MHVIAIVSFCFGIICSLSILLSVPRECRLHFISFGIIEPILVILKIEYAKGWGGGGGGYAASRTTVLHMKRLNQTESPIFLILCVLLFYCVMVAFPE